MIDSLIDLFLALAFWLNPIFHNCLILFLPKFYFFNWYDFVFSFEDNKCVCSTVRLVVSCFKALSVFLISAHWIDFLDFPTIFWVAFHSIKYFFLQKRVFIDFDARCWLIRWFFVFDRSWLRLDIVIYPIALLKYSSILYFSRRIDLIRTKAFELLLLIWLFLLSELWFSVRGWWSSIHIGFEDSSYWDILW